MKVLIVDDEPTVRKLLQRYLGEHGYEITVAENGAEGVAAAREVGPDLILSDVSMPVMDGYELVRTVRADLATASIPIILLSAHRASDDMVEGYRSGADDYISKPVDVEVLRHKIDALVRRAQPRPELPVVIPTAGRLVCVTSAKGGAGVTTVAANLAVLLGRSRTEQSVCAVDLDVAHGDLQVLLDLRPPGGLAQAVRDVAGDGAQWDDYLVRHEGGPWLLAAPKTPLEASELTDASISGVLAALRTSQDLLVVDVPPPTASWLSACTRRRSGWWWWCHRRSPPCAAPASCSACSRASTAARTGCVLCSTTSSRSPSSTARVWRRFCAAR